jgi:succinoglycan biosynthesis transport protein ExoP
MAVSDSAATTRGGFDPSAVVASIRGALGVILIVAAIAGAAAFLLFDRTPAMYLAEARVSVGIDDREAARLARAMDGEVQLIRSLDVARTAAASLGLAAVPEYRDSGDDVPMLRRLLVMLGLARDLRTLAPEERVLALYDENLVVDAVAGSNVVRIGFWSSDPVLAASGANAVADAYVALRQSAADEVTALRAEIARLETALGEGDARAEALRAELGALPPALDAATRDALLAERGALEGAIAMDTADAAAIRDALAAGRMADGEAFAGDPGVRALLDEQATLRAELAREIMEAPLGNPRVLEIGARLGAIQEDLAAAAERIATALAARADAGAARLAEIDGRLQEDAAATAAVDALAALEAQLGADRTALDAASNRLAALGTGGVFPAGSRVLVTAKVPTAPGWPDVAALTAVAFLATLALGIVVVVLRDLLTGRAFRRVPFVSPLADIEQPVQAAARMRRLDGDEAPRAGRSEPTIAPAGAAESSLRAVADSIAGRQRVVVTLAEESDAEGRPLAAVALARALSARDRTVILVDLRSDGANETAMGEIAELSGFTDLLSGDVSFSQAIFRDRRSRAHFIPLGRQPLAPEQLAGERLATLLTALDHTYDHVVIDCPDDAIPRMAPPADAALVVSDYGSADPRTMRAVSRVTEVSGAHIFYLLVEPGRRPADAAKAA